MQLFEKAPSKAELLAYIDTQHTPIRVGTICAHFGISCPSAERRKGSAYSQVRQMLRELVKAGEVATHQTRPRARHWYHSVPRLVESVQEEQEQTVVRFNVGLQPPGPAISIEELKGIVRKVEAKRIELQNKARKLHTEIEQLCHRQEVLLSLIQPFDEDFRLGLG